MPKTVAFFLSDLQSGGTEWFAVNLARALKERGYAIQFLLARASGDLLPEIQNEFPITNLYGGSYSPCGLMRCMPRLAYLLNKHHPDILISGLPLVNATAGIAKLLAFSPTKLIVVEHIRLSGQATQTCWLKHRAKVFLVWLTHRLANHFVCVSRTVAHDIQELFPHGKNALERIIYNPVIPNDLEVLAREPTTHPWLTDDELSLHQPLLVSIGRLLENKGYATLLEAFAKVRTNKTNARLIILGEGDERHNLEQKIKDLGLQDAVSMPGAVPNIFPYLKAASLFVLASHSEAFGNVIVEALACGIPVVSTDCGGPREILENGKYGTLVPIGDETALSQGILRTLETPVDRAVLKQRGQIFSVEKATNAYQALIESL